MHNFSCIIETIRYDNNVPKRITLSIINDTEEKSEYLKIIYFFSYIIRGSSINVSTGVKKNQVTPVHVTFTYYT